MSQKNLEEHNEQRAVVQSGREIRPGSRSCPQALALHPDNQLGEEGCVHPRPEGIIKDDMSDEGQSSEET